MLKHRRNQTLKHISAWKIAVTLHTAKDYKHYTPHYYRKHPDRRELQLPLPRTLISYISGHITALKEIEYQFRTANFHNIDKLASQCKFNGLEVHATILQTLINHHKRHMPTAFCKQHTFCTYRFLNGPFALCNFCYFQPLWPRHPSRDPSHHASKERFSCMKATGLHSKTLLERPYECIPGCRHPRVLSSGWMKWYYHHK
jgi:hypothetical protein